MNYIKDNNLTKEQQKIAWYIYRELEMENDSDIEFVLKSLLRYFGGDSRTSLTELTEAEEQIKDIIKKLPVKDAIYILEAIKHYMLMTGIIQALDGIKEVTKE